MKLIFMGSPDLSAVILKALYDGGHEITGVVTGTDKARGRKGTPVPTETEKLAEELGLCVLKTPKVRREEDLAWIREKEADAVIVAAFGQLLPPELLTMKRFGCINVHASLLPAYRGAAPIQWSVLNGEPQTGITIMQMDAGCDTGDILLQEAVAITEEDTGGSLFDKLSELGARMIVEALEKLEAGTLTHTKQDDALATMTGKIEKSSGRIDWTRDAAYLSRAVRAFTPWPGSVTTLHDKPLKICAARALEESDSAAPGTIVRVERDALIVQTGKGLLQITDVQPAGKKQMPVRDYLLGHKITEGTRFTH